MLQLGTLLEPEAALAAGLVDEVVPLHQLPAATAAALQVCIRELLCAQVVSTQADTAPRSTVWRARPSWRRPSPCVLTNPPTTTYLLPDLLARQGLVAMNETGRSTVKLQLRGAAAADLRANQSDDLDVFIRLVQQPRVQEQLGQYIEGLGQKQPDT